MVIVTVLCHWVVEKVEAQRMFLESTKTDLRRGEKRRGMPLTSEDLSGKLHNEDGSSHPSWSKPLPSNSTSAFSPSRSLPPDPGRTMAARQPSSCRPPAVSVPAPRIHAPPHALPQSTLCPSSAGRVRMELARSDNITNFGDEMKVASSRLCGGEVQM